MTSRLRLVLAASLILLVAACTDDGQGGEPPDATALSGSLLFWDTSANDDQAEQFRVLAQDFDDENPALSIEYTRIEGDLLLSQYGDAKREGRPPDVLRIASEDLPSLAAAGELVALTPGGDDAMDFVAVSWQAGQVQSQTYGFPSSAEVPMLLVNNASDDPATDRAGEVAAAWDTWAGITELAEQRQQPVVAGAFDAWTLLPFIYATGGRMLDPSTRQVLIAADDAVAGFQGAVDLIEGGVMLRPGYEDPAGAALRAFTSEEIPAMLATVADLETLDASTVSVLPPPAGPEGVDGSPYRGHHVAVSESTQEAGAAAELAGYLTSTAAQAAMAQSGMFPTRDSAYEANTVSQDRLMSQYRSVLDSAVAPAGVDGEAALYPILYSEWRNMVDGVTSVDDGALDTAQQWLSVLPTEYSITLR